MKPWFQILREIGLGLFLFLASVGILSAFLFPAASNARRNTERAHAEGTAYNLKNAISAFHTEYRDYPLPTPTKDVTTDSTHALMDILLGTNAQKTQNGRNPRGIVFYSDASGTGALWDPWGNHYRVRLDTDSDKQIENPEAPGTFLPETIAVWSAGPDGDFDTWKDNVKTW